MISPRAFSALRVAGEFTRDDAIIINLSGRGDKDVQLVADLEAHKD